MRYEEDIPHLSPATKLEHIAGQINRNDVTIISRPNGFQNKDVCMLAPMRDDPNLYGWIWLAGERAGFQSNRAGRTRSDLASTIMGGGWTIRGNATIALEGFPTIRQAAVAHSEHATVTHQANGSYSVTCRNRGSSTTNMDLSLKKALALFSNQVQERI